MICLCTSFGEDERWVAYTGSFVARKSCLVIASERPRVAGVTRMNGFPICADSGEVNHFSTSRRAIGVGVRMKVLHFNDEANVIAIWAESHDGDGLTIVVAGLEQRYLLTFIILALIRMRRYPERNLGGWVNSEVHKCENIKVWYLNSAIYLQGPIS